MLKERSTLLIVCGCILGLFYISILCLKVSILIGLKREEHSLGMLWALLFVPLLMPFRLRQDFPNKQTLKHAQLHDRLIKVWFLTAGVSFAIIATIALTGSPLKEE